MAALDLQEQEQIEGIKAWWKDNGNFVLGALLVVVVAMGGWRGWQYYQNKQSAEAATLYAEFTRQLQSNDAKRVNDAAAAVMEKFSGTAYASRAALMAAQVNEFGKDVARAKTQLQWVIDHAGEAMLKDVARLRLAAILMDEKAYDGAMKLLNAAHPDSFNGLYADLKGDVLSAQGKTDEARTAYKLAYEKTDEKSMYRNLIQMKMDALGAAK
ncbi:MAG: tetratricopeptide repeat protein [Gallionella sp.]|jgi:predicted negative regulator of RcsB-dependent stress response|nr:tetratricopeptide repeat protein [Gallionella sp.]MCK9354770.1 tetratricopeptide repeat protein [Gallionella sp.]